jgi:hypothetical protein
MYCKLGPWYFTLAVSVTNTKYRVILVFTGSNKYLLQKLTTKAMKLKEKLKISIIFLFFPQQDVLFSRPNGIRNTFQHVSFFFRTLVKKYVNSQISIFSLNSVPIFSKTFRGLFFNKCNLNTFLNIIRKNIL